MGIVMWSLSFPLVFTLFGILEIVQAYGAGVRIEYVFTFDETGAVTIPTKAGVDGVMVGSMMLADLAMVFASHRNRAEPLARYGNNVLYSALC